MSPSYDVSTQKLYEAFAMELAHALRSSLTASRVRVHAIEHRAKSIISVQERLLRPEKVELTAYSDLPDLAGVRVIVYYLEDIEKVEAVCRKLFEADNSSSRTLYQDPNQFGYQSSHLVVGISQGRSRMPEWEAFSGLRAEVQIRTVLQHAWADVSHSMAYKSETSVPIPLRRRLNRIAALLEIADQEFATVVLQHSELSEEAAREAESDPRHWDASVDVTTISTYIEQDEGVQEATHVAAAAGFEIRNSDDEPAAVVLLCERLEIWSISQLRQVVRGTQHRWRSYFRTLYSRSGDPWVSSRDFTLVLILVLLGRNSVSIEWLETNLGWDHSIAVHVLETAETFG